jgi:hypothetical protein
MLLIEWKYNNFNFSTPILELEQAQSCPNLKIISSLKIFYKYTNFHEDPIIISTKKSLFTPPFFSFCGVVNVEEGLKIVFS